MILDAFRGLEPISTAALATSGTNPFTGLTIPADAVAAAVSYEADARVVLGTGGPASGTVGILVLKNAIFGIDCLHRIRQSASYFSSCANAGATSPAGFVIFYSSNGKI